MRNPHSDLHKVCIGRERTQRSPVHEQSSIALSTLSACVHYREDKNNENYVRAFAKVGFPHAEELNEERLNEVVTEKIMIVLSSSARETTFMWEWVTAGDTGATATTVHEHQLEVSLKGALENKFHLIQGASE